MNNNIFLGNVKFGDKFLTRNGQTAIFWFFDYFLKKYYFILPVDEKYFYLNFNFNKDFVGKHFYTLENGKMLEEHESDLDIVKKL